MFPHEKGHDLEHPPASGAIELSSDRPAVTPQLVLSMYDKAAATTFASGAVEGLTGWATDCARSLTGADRNEARLRLLARTIAITAAQQRTLEMMLGTALAKRDERGVDMLNKTLTATSRRLVTLLAEHRLACTLPQRTPVVAVGQAEQVIVRAGR
jgi:hypothetical protein